MRQCIAAGGLPQGTGTNCSTVICEQPPQLGACCLANGTCIGDVQESECQAGGGTWSVNATCAKAVCTTAVEPKSWGKIKAIYR